MQVEIKLNNLEMIRVINDGSLLDLMKSVEAENSMEIPKKRPVEKKTVKTNIEKPVEIEKEAVQEVKTKPEQKEIESEFTEDQVRAMFASKNSPEQRSKLKALLKKYNAKNVSSIASNDYAAVMADLGEI